MALDQAQLQIIANCQQSVTYFLRNFCKLKHPSAGVLPFNPFGYQVEALRAFREHRFCCFRKCRQSGISKIAGAYALWTAMFFAHKTVLIVSRTDDDAMKFLEENIRFIFRLLPPWMQQLWAPIDDNKHQLTFPNGSSIQSLTSAQDVLRSNASSLNIIDEAAFIEKADVMWSAGWSTLMHGGRAIVISTANGIGNWYWSIWTDAEAGQGVFHPIVVNWWDMTWSIEYVDSIDGKVKRIAPTDGIIPTKHGQYVRWRGDKVHVDPERYGEFWSPWLEEQWRGLQERGESWKFEQEVLARFVGSGNTIIPASVIAYIGTTISTEFERITGNQTYVHPVTGQPETIDYTFPGGDGGWEEGLWLFRRPKLARPARYSGKQLIDPGSPAHVYAMGVDTATGKGRDFHAVEVFDVTEQEQVAEFMAHCLPKLFAKIVDHIGRWYNAALMVIERNNGGDNFIEDVRELMYPRLWRKIASDDKPRQNGSNGRGLHYAAYGFYTGDSTKPVLNQFLCNYLKEREGEGYTIYSKRLLKQLSTYVRKKDRSGRDTGKTGAQEGAGNYDDLVIAAALALVGAPDTIQPDSSTLLPFLQPNEFVQASPTSSLLVPRSPEEYLSRGGPDLLIPMGLSGDPSSDATILQQIENFSLQLGMAPPNSQPPRPAVSAPRYQIVYKR